MSTPPFKVKAVYEYTSPHEDDLHFSNGQIITVTENDEEDWYTGEYVDDSGAKQEGIFPRNFVEKYEPTAPPRPVRAARPKKEEVVVQEESGEPVPIPAASKPTAAPRAEEPPAARNVPPAALQASSTAAPTVTRSVEAPAPVQVQAKSIASSKAAPPPVSEKPSGGSFRDRIAAFNKPAAGPAPVPFKPSGLGSGGTSGFIKKPFVAPPPSKDAYVPIPKPDIPQKVYRREEDPDVVADEAEIQELAAKAGLTSDINDGDGEDQPKPTSLKDRIALLQKQQMEQAQRHAEAAAKKEKPKRPVKKRTESQEHQGNDEEDGAELERHNTRDTVGKQSMDSARGESVTRAPLPRRKSSKGPPAIPGGIRESDGNDADMSGAGYDTEEPEDSPLSKGETEEKPRAKAPAPPARAPAAPRQEPDVGEEEGPPSEPEPEAVEDAGREEEDEEEEDEDIDPEVRRKEELRARMAKMSGGMGMHGMFGPPGGIPMGGVPPPAKKKAPSGSSQKQPLESEDSVAIGRAPPIPMPGMSRVKSPEEIDRHIEIEQEEEHRSHPITGSRQPSEVPDVEDIGPAPPLPGGRPAPPPVPSDSRPQVPAPQAPLSPSPGSESDDERSLHTPKLSLQTPTTVLPDRSVPPRPTAPAAPSMPSRPNDSALPPNSPLTKRASYFGGNAESNPTSPTTSGASKRQSRIPPIPGSSPTVATMPPLPPVQSRAPPPPPPNAPPLSRSSTGDAHVLDESQRANQEESDEEVTEYEGDYDTDIASAAPHKDALKAHARDSSIEDFSGSATSPPMSPMVAPPPLPPVSAPRAVPPPPPSQPPRQSVDVPRAAPPPPPPPAKAFENDDDEYDPYKYTAPLGSPPIPGISRQSTQDDVYGASPPRAQASQMAQERAAPPPPPREFAPPPQPSAGKSRQSMDAQVQRTQSTMRRSMDMNRMSMDNGFVAMDIDLAEDTKWWTIADGVPPAFQNRKDLLYETEETTSAKRGGKTTITKDIYVLFQDYSQTVITVSFDAHNPSDAKVEQRHEQPPSRLRQDQLESAWERFGHRIGDAAASKKDSVVGDGTPAGLVTVLLKPFADALLPVGTRAYGALVYANLANASVAQHDEIRPGDIITLRNAKLQGKHGPMHAKYSTEVGAGIGHVAVVAEWDGTKKKIRAWEQGRESKKVKLESFKLDDLRSGEVKIWRVMPRSWVGWEGSN